MEARAESPHGAEIKRQKIEKQGAVCFGCERYHFSFLIVAGMVVNPLKVGGFATKARAIVDKLAVNLSSGKVYERHKPLSFVAVYL
jgi:hypothetical protein